MTSRTHTRRQLCLGLGFTALTLLYAVRLGHLQIGQAETFRARAVAQSAEFEVLPARRGEILDRHGEALAADDTRYRAYLAVRELDGGRDGAIAAIQRVVDLTSERKRALREASRGWTWFAVGLTDEERVTLEGQIGRGVHFDNYPARAYPRGGLARRLIGRVGTEGIGTTGLELHLDSLLRGEPGRSEVRLDGRGRAYRPPDGERVEPRAGYDVVLSIDAELQRIAENELDRALERTGAEAGDIILLDPRTGELLALASERAGAAPGHVPAFSDAYEPGSTIKPFLLAALLNEGLVDLEESIDVERGVLRIGRRVIRDVRGYERLTVREIITRSSNVGAAKLATRLKPSVQQSYLRDFGFGLRTQVGHPAESNGRLTRVADWTALSPASHAIGYELATTSLQLAAAYGALANDGVLMRPLLIKEVRDAQGRTVWRARPQEVRRVVSSDVSRAVSAVLEEAVQAGTGTMARMASLSVAGKTGTARLAAGGGYAQGRYRASFVGYAPADRPRVVVLTRLEDPAAGSYYGGTVAAPTSHATLEAALATKGVLMDERLAVSATPRSWADEPTGGEEAGPFIFAVDGVERAWPDPDEAPRGHVAVPDLTGLSARSAAARLHELGLTVEWLGRETVRAQTPAPGSEVTRGGRVVLR